MELTVTLVIIAFLAGCTFGMMSLAIVRFTSRTWEERDYPRYRHWKDNEIVEVLESDALAVDTATLEHYVIYRNVYGKQNIYVRPKHIFFGKVHNFKGEELNRFTKITTQ